MTSCIRAGVKPRQRGSITLECLHVGCCICEWYQRLECEQNEERRKVDLIYATLTSERLSSFHMS
jgi:hypothetical protein